MKLALSRSLRLLPLSASCLFMAVTCGGLTKVSAEEPIIPPIIIAPAPNVVVLKGKISDLSLEPNASGSKIKVKALITISNTGSKLAKSVSAAVFLSPDKTLTSTEQPIAKLELSSFNKGDGKIEPGSKVSIPVNYKLPAQFAAGLTGQYLIVVLSSNGKTQGKPIVFGPIPKVP